MSPDIFLRDHGMRADNIVMKGSPAEVVSTLQALNKLRHIDPQTGLLVDNRYITPGFAPGPMGPTSYAIWREINLAMAAYRTALKTGDLAAVYAAVDEVNNWRMQGGYNALNPPPDFYILGENPNTPLGAAVRIITSEREAVQESIERGDNPPVGTAIGSPLPWYDTVAAFHALNSYVPTTKPEGTPSTNVFRTPVPIPAV